MTIITATYLGSRRSRPGDTPIGPHDQLEINVDQLASPRYAAASDQLGKATAAELEHLCATLNIPFEGYTKADKVGALDVIMARRFEAAPPAPDTDTRSETDPTPED